MSFWELFPVAAALLCIGIALLPERGGIRHAVRTRGVVTGWRTQPGRVYRTETPRMAPAVTFEADGREITGVSEQFVPEWQYRFHTGDTVNIYYDRENPERFHVCGGAAPRRILLLTVGITTLVAYFVLMIPEWLRRF